MVENSVQEPLLPKKDDKPKEQEESVSRNVYVSYVMIFIWGLADSIWSGAILSAWLFLLAGGSPEIVSFRNQFLSRFNLELRNTFNLELNLNDASHANTIVGGIEALQGLAGLFTALPIGYLADTYGRAPMCKIGGFGFIISTITTSTAVLGNWSTDTEITILGLSLIMWGIFGGIYSGPSQALFADSVPKGLRSKYYTYLALVYQAPSLVGPLIAIALFQKYGDHWTFEELRLPFMVGICLELPAAALAFFLRDDLALKEEEENDEVPDLKGEDEEEMKLKRKKQSYIVPVLGKELTRAHIPYILFTSDLLYALGSGMTIKFFPLFFMKEIKLTPSSVQFLKIAVTVVLMGASLLAQKASSIMGRVQVVTAARMSGIVLLVIMSVLVSHGYKSAWITIPLYVLRTAVMNCPYALDESILMDNVKKNERSQWKALESVTVMGWCGSAFIGGLLADRYSYDFSFLLTAIVQMTGGVMYCLLIPLVLDEVAPIQRENSNNGENNTSSDQSSSTLSEA